MKEPYALLRVSTRRACKLVMIVSSFFSSLFKQNILSASIQKEPVLTKKV